MNTDDQVPTTIRLDSMSGLVASLPALLGFTPAQSLVVIALHHSGGRSRVGAMMRADLPTDPADAHELAAVARQRVALINPDAINLVIVAEGADPGTETGSVTEAAPAPGTGAGRLDLPHRGIVDALTVMCGADGIEVTQAVWTPRVTAGSPWRCYFGCRCHGEVSDPRASQAAAHTAMSGRVTFRSREEAAAALAADPDAEHPQRRACFDVAHAAHRAARDPWTGDPTQAARDDLTAIRAAIGAIRRGEALDAVTLARVVVALHDPAVRDVAAGFALGSDPTVDPEHAAQLWWTLTRGAPAPEVAEPATLVAIAALTRGGSAVLTVALERAAVADPTHQLSRLVGALLEQLGHPQQISSVLLDAATEAAQTLTL